MLHLFNRLFDFMSGHDRDMEIKMAQLREIALAINEIRQSIGRAQASLDNLSKINHQMMENYKKTV